MTRLTALLLAGVLVPVMGFDARAAMGPHAAPAAGDLVILAQDVECGPGTGVKCARNDGGDGETKKKKKKQTAEGEAASGAEETLKKRKSQETGNRNAGTDGTGERKRGEGEQKAKRNEGGGSGQADEAGERRRKNQDAEAEAKRKADADREAKRKADREAEAKRKADREAEAKRKADREAEAKRKADREAEAKRKADADREAKRKADREAEAKRKTQQESVIGPRRDSLGDQLERDGARRNDSGGGDAEARESRRERVERLRAEREKKAERVRRERDAERERERRETLRDVREERRERREADGRVIIEEGRGRRIVTGRDGAVVIFNDERDRLRYESRDVIVRQLPNGFEETTVWRDDGTRVVTVRDRWGNVVERSRILYDGRRYVLFSDDPRYYDRPDDIIVRLPLPPILIPRDRYVVAAEAAPPEIIYETFAAPPVVPVERRYGLQQVVNSPDLLDRVRRVDLDSITFASGSWQVDESQIGALDAIADSLLQLIDGNPAEVFLIEGHTDAVGSDLDNLSLSDRRAEEVAYLLTEYYAVPAENLTTKGYGERYLKVPTQGPARENRRVTMRRITPLLETAGR
jgi:outer membrane protein OmpA-like peptidoglycan-associated protein